MKLQRTDPEGFVFQLSGREKQLLFEIIKLYPLVPATHHRLTRAAAAQSAENQRLLEESLAQQRAEHRRQLDVLLNEPVRLQKNGSGFRLQLKTVEIEWLLQVLNDVRVGSWLKLGEPDEARPPEVTPENFQYVLAMDVCGAFQSAMLAAWGETESPDWLS